MLTDNDAVRMAAVDELEAHKAERPGITRIITDDATSEAVKSLLAEHGGAIAVVSAESAFLSNTAGGRYGDAPNLDVILNGHAGDSIHVDRTGRPSETVDRACLTLNLMVQRPVIQDLGKSQGFITRGGAARLLTSFPDDILGRRRIDVEPVPPELSQQWSEAITRIVTRKPTKEHGSYVPWTLSLAEGAKATFREYRAWHEPRMVKNGTFGDIRDWAGKQCGAVLRIAGLLHIVQNETPETVPISAATLQRAITIMDYYAEHARIMYRLMNGNSEQSAARTVLAALQSLENPTTRRDVHRKLRGRSAFTRATSLESPLILLEEYGYIKRDHHTGEKGGRPSEVIHLNPLVDMDKTDTTPEHYPDAIGSVGFVHVVPKSAPTPPSGKDETRREPSRTALSLRSPREVRL
jgi:hypothetical protein